jgi:cell wall-associated NlpC family hydrolase
MNIKVLFFAFVLLLGLHLTAADAEGFQKKGKKQTGKIHHVKSRHRHAAADISLVGTTELIDTCTVDTNETLVTMSKEINRWSNARYHLGGLTKRGVDCSGFALNVYRNALSVTLPRTSSEQAKVGEPIDKDELVFGDLLFFYKKLHKKAQRNRIGHVAIYIGDGNFVHSSRHKGVGIDSLDERYFAKHFAGARRVMDLSALSKNEEQ